tara:strand:- start:33 stop:428 length:396 start_codon:yes stop_codon:yes gene_type:complete
MKSRLEKVYKKLPNQKVDLKAQKIKLSILSDLENDILFGYNAADRVEKVLKEAEKLTQKLKSEIETAKNNAIDIIYSDFGLAIGNIDDGIMKATNSLEELGAPTNVLDEYKDALSDLDRIIADFETMANNL